MRRFFIALAAVAAIAVAPLQLHATLRSHNAASTAAQISIPFNPPLDRPLHYRSSVSSQRGGQSAAVSTDYEITFSRRAGGFRMLVHATGARDDRTGRPSPGFLPPYTLLLDESGGVEELEDADAYWEGIVLAARPALRTMNGGITNSALLSLADYALRDATPEARLNHLTRYIGPILDYASDDYVLGEERVQVDPIAGLMGTSVTQRLVFRAERVADGRLFMSTEATVPGDEMRDELIAAFERAPANGQTQEERAASLARMRATRMERTVTARFELAVATGLVLRLTQTDLFRRTVSGRVIDSVQTLVIEALD